MKLVSIFISAGASAVALILSVILFAGASGTITQQGEFQKRQQTLQDINQKLQVRSQELQLQEQTLKQGEYWSKQAAPAVFQAIAVKSVKNDKLAAILKKYNMSGLVDQAKKAQSESPTLKP
jgi:hypothetical protein